MVGRLAGKKIVVTAAAQGIGRATVEAFLNEGAEVWASDINEKALGEIATEKCHTARLDVTSNEDVETYFAGIPHIDVLFNCAGFVHNGTILECDEAMWDFTMNINVKSMYRTCKSVIPKMVAQGHGNIINMSSAASSIKGAPNRFVYGTSKAAVIGFTKAIAQDFVDKGIRCNAVCPGTVDTPSLKNRMEALGGDFEEVKKTFIARQKMGRMAQPKEIANLLVFLASDESSFTTGTTEIIDGGWSL